MHIQRDTQEENAHAITYEGHQAESRLRKLQCLVHQMLTEQRG